MELSSFSENIVTEIFERNGETVELKINRDAIVPEYFDVIADRLKPATDRVNELAASYDQLQKEVRKLRAEEKKKKKPTKPADLTSLMSRMREVQKGIAEINREIFAERLTCPVSLPDGSTTCLLKGWDMTDNGNPIPPSKQNLLRLPPPAVEALFEFVNAKIETVKKKAESETEETSDDVPDTSAGLRVVGQNT